MNKVFVWDMETDGLLYEGRRIHCIASGMYERGSSGGFKRKVLHKYFSKEIASFLSHVKWCMENEVAIIGHNISGFDIPFLVEYSKRKGCYSWLGILSELMDYRLLFDTMIMSCIYRPERQQHSLESWEEIMPETLTKVSIASFKDTSSELIHRCVTDVEMTVHVFEHLLKSIRGLVDQQRSRLLEQKVAYCHAFQTARGVAFDKKKAEKLKEEIESMIPILEEKVYNELPEFYVKVGTISQIFKINGEPTKVAERYGRTAQVLSLGKLRLKKRNWGVSYKGRWTDTIPKKHGPSRIRAVPVGKHTVIKRERISLSSSPQLKKALLYCGWKPTEFTEKGSPKITEDSFDSLPGNIGEPIKTLYMFRHRLAFLNGALENIRDDGRVTADAFTCATPTSRYRHFGTCVNIPGIKAPYGEEIRSLFTVNKKRREVLIGADLVSIEAYSLVHYLMKIPGSEDVCNKILSPDKSSDFHSSNAVMWGVTRDVAKRAYYAILYGCGAKKLARILGIKEKEGKKALMRFWKINKAIKELKVMLKKEYDMQGFITGIDGRPLYIREKYKILNSVLQHTAAIIFKMWMVEVNWKLPDLQQYIAMHDELQLGLIEVPVEKYKGIVRRCTTEFNVILKKVALRLALNVVITADVKLGHNWAETH